MNNNWWKNYNLAKAYYEENGNLKVPKLYVCEDGAKLGYWIRAQRIAYMHRIVPKEMRVSKLLPLTDEQVRLLESIGMLWQIKKVGNYEDNWHAKYNLSKAYYEENGNLEIPVSYVSEDGTNLGSWIFTQRQAYKNRIISPELRISTVRPLTDEQVELLESIGMLWQLRESANRKDNWQKKYNLAKAYYEKNGNLKIPVTYVSEDGTKLGAWIFMQRQAYRNRIIPLELRTSTMRPLTDEQVELLESIGMLWLKGKDVLATKVTKLNQVKIKKLFLKILNNYVKKHRNEIVSYEVINSIEQDFMDAFFDSVEKQKIK